MPSPDLAIPTRAPAEVSADDTVLPFEVPALDLRGRVVRLGPAVDKILESHDYPEPVAKLLGEAIVLGVLLGSALKFEGRFILQTQTDGPVRMLVVDFMTPDKVRACARFDKNRVAEAIASGATDAGTMLGRGHLAMTIDQGRRHEPLSGAGRARRRQSGRRRARVFPALRADPDARAPRGCRGTACRGRRSQSHLARRRAPVAIRSARAGAGARSRSSSRRCARGHDAARGAGGRRLGRRPFAWSRPSRMWN
jgi:hypothetical protein